MLYFCVLAVMFLHLKNPHLLKISHLVLDTTVIDKRLKLIVVTKKNILLVHLVFGINDIIGFEDNLRIHKGFEGRS